MVAGWRLPAVPDRDMTYCLAEGFVTREGDQLGTDVAFRFDRPEY